MVQADGETHDGDPSDGVDDGQVGDTGGSPYQMNERDRGSAIDQSAYGCVTEIPGTILGASLQIAKLDVQPIGGDGRDGSSSGPGYCPAVLLA